MTGAPEAKFEEVAVGIKESGLVKEEPYEPEEDSSPRIETRNQVRVASGDLNLHDVLKSRLTPRYLLLVKALEKSVTDAPLNELVEQYKQQLKAEMR